MRMMNTKGNVLAAAAGLISEDGENPEYDRAIVEMTSELLGLPITDNREMVERTIREWRDDL